MSAFDTTYLYTKVKFLTGWKAAAYTSDIIVPTWFSGGDPADTGNYFWINAVQAAGQVYADGHAGAQGFLDWWTGDILGDSLEDTWYEVETKTVFTGLDGDGFGIFDYDIRLNGANVSSQTGQTGFGVNGGPTDLGLGAFYEFNAWDDFVYFEKVAYCTDGYFRDGAAPVFFYDFIPGTVIPPFSYINGGEIVTLP